MNQVLLEKFVLRPFLPRAEEKIGGPLTGGETNKRALFAFCWL